MSTSLFKHLSKIPHAPGVYFFKDAKGKILYIGKAKDLQKRLSQYRDGRENSSLTAIMVAKARHIDFLVAPNEIESLIWEHNLIKEHQPRYNIMLRDDKGYLYIRISKETYPKITTAHRVEKDEAEYLGPFTSSEYVTQTLKTLREIFPYRTCETLPKKPCLYFFMKLCSAPCIGNISEKQYAETIQQIRRVISGRNEEVVQMVKKEMRELSREQHFEEAAIKRNQMHALQGVAGHRTIGDADEDIISIAKIETQAAAHVMMIRNQRMIRQETFLYDHASAFSEADILESFLLTYYQYGAAIPKKLLVSHLPSNHDIVVKWLAKESLRKKNSIPKIIFPQKGSKKRLINIGLRNAEEKIKWKKIERASRERKTDMALRELQAALHLPSLPRRIECYDISNIQGTNAVGSMVVLENGVPKKSDYRRFVIKTVEGANDFAMMQEVLSRRLKHSEWPAPDLFLLDGGRGQLSAVLEIFQRQNIRKPLAALAKREEEIYLPGKRFPVRLLKTAKALHLLQMVRDEAHRFAISHYRIRHRKSLFQTAPRKT